MWARVLSLEVLLLSLTTKNKPSQLSDVFATDPSSDPTPTTKEYKDELLSGTWLSSHRLILSHNSLLSVQDFLETLDFSKTYEVVRPCTV